jgi:predicted RNase H-like nuclease (RuvC/YqgF family)
LPSCPNCGTGVENPARVFTVIVEPKEGERGLTQRKVGMYACEKCGTKFPTVVGRQHYLVVAEDQLNQIQADIKGLKKTNNDLDKRISMMDKEYEELQQKLERSKKDAENRVLETKLDALEKHVAYLRKEKDELEERTKSR